MESKRFAPFYFYCCPCRSFLIKLPKNLHRFFLTNIPVMAGWLTELQLFRCNKTMISGAMLESIQKSKKKANDSTHIASVSRSRKWRTKVQRRWILQPFQQFVKDSFLWDFERLFTHFAIALCLFDWLASPTIPLNLFYSRLKKSRELYTLFQNRGKHLTLLSHC